MQQTKPPRQQHRQQPNETEPSNGAEAGGGGEGEAGTEGGGVRGVWLGAWSLELECATTAPILSAFAGRLDDIVHAQLVLNNYIETINVK